MSLTLIKIIACISMLIDHLTATFVPILTPLYTVGRLIGRLTLPLFCFALVEGFFHTRSIKKYFLRLGILAVISELPFDMLTGLLDFDNVNVLYIFSYQNTIITLFIGLFAITMLETVKNKYFGRSNSTYNTLGVVIIVGSALTAEFLNSDYTSMGVLLIVIFYYFREQKIPTIICMAIWTLFYVSVGSYLELASLLALIPIFLYDKTRGTRFRGFFYAFYPLHMVAIALIRDFIVKG